MISFGDMLDELEKNEPQKETTVAKKKGGDSEPGKKGGDNEPENKDCESEKEKQEVDDSEDVI